MKQNFVSNLAITLISIVKIALTITAKVIGLLNLGWLLTILCVVVAFFVPMGFTICFVVCKLTGGLLLGWGYIVLTLVADIICAVCMKDELAGKR